MNSCAIFHFVVTHPQLLYPIQSIHHSFLPFTLLIHHSIHPSRGWLVFTADIRTRMPPRVLSHCCCWRACVTCNLVPPSNTPKMVPKWFFNCPHRRTLFWYQVIPCRTLWKGFYLDPKGFLPGTKSSYSKGYLMGQPNNYFRFQIAPFFQECKLKQDLTLLGIF